jgi:antitoxin component YwqK of YwqJK toxin-antitoxin module
MERVDFNELDEVQDEWGLWIVTDQNGNPFTGIVFETSDESISYEGEHVNGRICGYEKRWHPNGQLSSMEQKYNNSYHGIAKSWYENGVLKFDAKNEYGINIWYVRYNEHGDITETYDIKEHPEKYKEHINYVNKLEEKGIAQLWNSIFN